MGQVKKMQATSLLVYTRKVNSDYTESLANSIHFAYSDNGEDYIPLNQNYGILFAEATIDQNNVIQEKGLQRPYLFYTKEGRFGVMAIRVDKYGNEDEESKGQVLLWTSENLVDFKYHGLVKLHDQTFVHEVACKYNEVTDYYEVYWKDQQGKNYISTLPDLNSLLKVSAPQVTEDYLKEDNETEEKDEAILPDTAMGNRIYIEQEMVKELKANWLPIYNTEVIVPEGISLSSVEELQQIRATAIYSDGSTTEKKVQWDTQEVDFTKPGTYTVHGKVIQENFPFPLAKGYADPVILPWQGKYYYLATNDNLDDIGIYVREGSTKSELFEEGYKESLILDVDEEKNFIQTFWAPEFHVIHDDLYILFAVGGKVWGPQCHMMKLKKGGDITKAEDWETPIRVRRADGSYLAEDGITLDMTYFKADDTSCVIWSYRKHIGTPLDSGSMLYIATIDEKNPTVLTSEPVLLTRPLFGWENIQGTINNEGPYCLITEDHVYVTYSGGAAGGYTYALGMLSIPRKSNYLDVSCWKKECTPVLSYYSMEGVYGPGHNSFFKDYNGSTMIMYHGEVKLAQVDTRCTGMHRVHFNKKGRPIFNLSKERDMNPMLSQVTTHVIIK